MGLFNENPIYPILLESLGEMEVNYNHFNHPGFNQDDQEDQGCPPCIQMGPKMMCHQKLRPFFQMVVEESIGELQSWTISQMKDH